MSFFTLSFAAFFSCVFFLWWFAPVKYRPLVLALVNFGFAFSLGARVAVLLAAITAIGWLAGKYLAKKPTRAGVWISAILLLLPLAGYKYLPLLSEHFAWAGMFAKLLAPLGLSFYTFKSLSYIIDVYKGKQQPVQDAASYFSYIGFFPQLAMGPIQRPQPFFTALDQISQKLNEKLAYSGCTRICWALFLKKCLADPLAGYQGALVSPERYYPLSMLWSLLIYSLYLYFDFAAYSQLAIGLGELLGLPCAENFRSPYYATSLGDFWHRWHISLSSFLREYVYFPLGGSRNGIRLLIVSTMGTFLLSGVWHGATSGFLVWGALHGVCLLIGRATYKSREWFWSKTPRLVAGPIRHVCGWAFTMLLVVTGWFFFYAGTIPQAAELARQMFVPMPLSMQYIKESIVLLGFTPQILLLRGSAFVIAALVDWLCRKEGFGAWSAGLRPWVRVVFCYLCVFNVLFWGEGASLPGVYFAF